MVAVVVGLAPSALLAQDAGDDEARALFLRGAEAYRSESYAVALEAFEASYAARPVPVVLFNIAQTLRALDRPAEAIEAYRGYLRTDDELDDARRRAVEAVITELAPAVAFVRLEIFPDEAEVRVDGRVLGRAPFTERVAVDPGERRFEASAEGHVAASRTLTLEAGADARLRLALREEPPAGTLRLHVDVVGTEVIVDEQTRGTIADEPFELRLDVGRHALELRASGYEEHRAAFELEDDATHELHVALHARESITGQWWFWTAVGGAVLVGVVIALAVALPARADPLAGTLPTVGALRFGR